MDVSATPPMVVSQAGADIDVSRPGLPFEVFYRDRADSIVRALALTLGDVELAADATNEAMTRAYQRWSRVSSYDNPAAWVYRVGLNWSLSWKRRRRRERERPVEFAAVQNEAGLRDDSLDRPLNELSLDHRAVIVCRVHLDLSVEQTAQVLDIAPGTVKSRLSRAVAQLRESLTTTAPEVDRPRRRKPCADPNHPREPIRDH